MTEEQANHICNAMQEIAVEINSIASNIEAIAVRDDGFELRDRIASSVLNGMLASGEYDLTKTEYVKYAYQYADAMIEARE